MRKDSVGFFWDDTPPPKPPKAEKAKRTPPEPVWLSPDYLPGLEEAQQFNVERMTVQELMACAQSRDELVLDVESYPNYFLAMFRNLTTGKVFYFEQIAGVSLLDTQGLGWVLKNCLTSGFNSNSYDLTVCYLASCGLSTQQLDLATQMLISQKQNPRDVLKHFGVSKFPVDHIDLIEVAPLMASLKTYAGRLHAAKMQDLPFSPGTILTQPQIDIVRYYCVNDTVNTAELRTCLAEHIKLREQMSEQYGVDLRSKSDAQIAEAVIAHELQRITGQRPRRPTIPVGTAYRYNVPNFMRFFTPNLQQVLFHIANSWFYVGETGGVELPEWMKNFTVTIGETTYKMGIGGLHSTEKKVSHYTSETHVLCDRDVTSYYPFIILNQGLAPAHLGDAWLEVYRSIVDRRIAAKASGDKVIADSLKIVINGSFGKLGSMWSILYSPDLLIQVTLTGQLSLMMLIEALESVGIPVVSANTDGVVINCPRDKQDLMLQVVHWWEQITNFQTEETRYMSLHSKDVNNYIAVKMEGKEGAWVEKAAGTKNKGLYANPWNNKKNLAERLHKNPTATICTEAAEQYLLTGRHPLATVQACNDITKFVSVRTVKGGAVQVRDIPNSALFVEYVGKTVRWYYAKDEVGELVYAESGNRVPKSQGAHPLMVMDGMPDNVDVDWYAAEAERILRDVGALAA